MWPLHPPIQKGCTVPNRRSRLPGRPVLTHYAQTPLSTQFGQAFKAGLTNPRCVFQDCLEHRFKPAHDELMTFNISDVAVSCSRASSSSQVSRAISVSRSTIGKPAAFGVDGLRCRVLTAPLPALERRFIAPPGAQEADRINSE